MNGKVFYLQAILIFVFVAFVSKDAAAQQVSRSPRAPSEDLGRHLTPTQNELCRSQSMRSGDHEAEIRVFEERLQSQESSFEYFRQQMPTISNPSAIFTSWRYQS